MSQAGPSGCREGSLEVAVLRSVGAGQGTTVWRDLHLASTCQLFEDVGNFTPGEEIQSALKLSGGIRFQGGAGADVNKMPHTGWLEAKDKYSLTVLESRRVKSRCRQGRLSLKTLLKGPSLAPWLIHATPLSLPRENMAFSLPLSPNFLLGLGSTLIQQDFVLTWL